MRRGCFFKLFYILIILIAAVYYFVKTYGDEVFSPVKEKAKKELVQNLNRNLLTKIEETAEDSLKQRLFSLREILKKKGEKLSFDELKKISSNIGELLKENVVNSETIKNIQEKIKNYEESKKK